jgi:hypothetical protein
MKVARIPAAVAMASLLAAGSAFADRTLWLQTEDGMLEVPLKAGQSMSVLADGDVSAVADDEFVCSMDDGASCEDVEVSLTDSFSSFSISPSTVTQGANVTISWRARGAWECVGSGLPGTTWNSGNPKVPAGSTTVSTSALAAGTSYSVAIECSNGPESASRTVSLNVSEPDGGTPASCDDRPPLGTLPDWSPASDVVIGSNPNPGIYTEVFPGDAFPGTTNNFPFYLRKGEYAAMRFTVPSNLSARGGWRIAPYHSGGSTYGQGLAFVTLSRCPGDFDVATMDDPNCGRISDTGEGWLVPRWSTNPNDPQASRCHLEPGETYYMNVLFSGTLDQLQFPPVQHDCQGRSRCAAYLQTGLD